MKELHDKYLCEKYPLLYRDRHGSPQKTLMCWGFTCGDGWFEIIEQLSAKLESEIQALKDQGTPEENLPVAVQVKEKFGGLRFYMDAATESMYKAIGEAEDACDRTCEECGEPGTLRTDRGWIQTLCDKCAYPIERKPHG